MSKIAHDKAVSFAQAAFDLLTKAPEPSLQLNPQEALARAHHALHAATGVLEAARAPAGIGEDAAHALLEAAARVSQAVCDLRLLSQDPPVLLARAQLGQARGKLLRAAARLAVLGGAKPDQFEPGPAREHIKKFLATN